MRKILERIKYTASKEDGGLKKLSEKVGIKYNTLYSLMSGKNENPKIGTLRIISDYYNIKLSEIFSEDDVVHFDSINEIKLEEEKISIVNDGYIDSIPRYSLFIFKKYTNTKIEVNFYLSLDNDNKVRIRKGILEDERIKLISLNNIEKSDEKIIYQLVSVEI